jgi:hypothetical protein
MKMIHPYEDSEESSTNHPMSLADFILAINSQLAKKPQSTRALRRAETRKLKPKYR